MQRVSSTVLVGILALGSGCPRSGAGLSDYVGTKWEGYIDVTEACQHGGYTGGDLKICTTFSEESSGLLVAHVDWDAAQLREDCGYFPFVGRTVDAGLQLVRWEDSERDDLLVLERHGDRLTGTLQVHPSCAQWPVQMSLIPQAPGRTMAPPPSEPEPAPEPLQMPMQSEGTPL